jgi:hypothetical protein
MTPSCYIWGQLLFFVNTKVSTFQPPNTSPFQSLFDYDPLHPMPMKESSIQSIDFSRGGRRLSGPALFEADVGEQEVDGPQLEAVLSGNHGKKTAKKVFARERERERERNPDYVL